MWSGSEGRPKRSHQGRTSSDSHGIGGMKKGSFILQSSLEFVAKSPKVGRPYEREGSESLGAEGSNVIGRGLVPLFSTIYSDKR